MRIPLFATLAALTLTVSAMPAQGSEGEGAPIDEPTSALLAAILGEDEAGAATHLTGKKIYVDPGHGGSDSGACWGGRCEDAWTLGAGLKLRDILVNQGASVRMSRTTDTYVSPGARASDANAWGAHRFVSIHLNSCGGCGGTGTEVLVCGSNSNTLNLASKIRSEITSHLSLRDRGTKQRCDLTVLSQTNMPANLAEVAFIDNNNDWAKIDTSSEQQVAACSIAHAISLHYGTWSTCS